MASDISGKERERRGKALSAAAQEWVATILLPTLAQAIEEALGSREGWSIEADPDDRDRQTVLFNYPASSGYGLDYGANYGGRTGYVQPRIKLEFGARGDPEPVEQRDILPYVAEDFPGEVPDASTTVPTLALERTYWEKATILHALRSHAAAHADRRRGEVERLLEAAIEDERIKLHADATRELAGAREGQLAWLVRQRDERGQRRMLRTLHGHDTAHVRPVFGIGAAVVALLADAAELQPWAQAVAAVALWRFRWEE